MLKPPVKCYHIVNKKSTNIKMLKNLYFVVKYRCMAYIFNAVAIYWEMTQLYIPFSPPDMTEREAELVKQTILSGWITSGPKKVQFENKLSEYCGT